MGTSQPDVARQHAQERLPASFAWRRKEVAAKVPRPQSPGYVYETSDHQCPGRLEMKISAPAVLVGQYVAISSRNCGTRGGDWNPKQRRSQRIAGFTPVKTRVRDENLNPG